MGSTFYLFYMVLFTGGVLWCLFLWLARDDEEEGEEHGAEELAARPPSPRASARAALDGQPPPQPSASAEAAAGRTGATGLPPEEAK